MAPKSADPCFGSLQKRRRHSGRSWRSDGQRPCVCGRGRSWYSCCSGAARGRDTRNRQWALGLRTSSGRIWICRRTGRRLRTLLLTGGRRCHFAAVERPFKAGSRMSLRNRTPEPYSVRQGIVGKPAMRRVAQMPGGIEGMADDLDRLGISQRGGSCAPAKARDG